jgi:hypothetical protein
MNTILNEFNKYLTGLTATNSIVTSLGVSIVANKTLYLGVEPDIATKMLSVIPYSSSPPVADHYYSNVQIRIKTKTNSSAINTGQAIINVFNRNKDLSASFHGMVEPIQSNPILLPPQEGGEFKIGIVNLRIKHIKL